jgi:septal ring factor EnvC (AmiA/AmiB activator)
MHSAALRPLPLPLLLLFPLLLLLPPGTAAPAAAQQQQQQQHIQRDIRDSRARLDSIQAERTRLQREMDRLRTRVRDASRELLNIERQRETSHSAMLELEFQAALLNDNIEEVARAHDTAQERLRARTQDMHQRLRTIYMRGRLHSAQVLLTSRSFADLLNRYKYLHLMAMYDRMVVEDVARLERQIAAQERELRETLERLELLRAEKAGELAELQRVERQRQATLRQFRQQESRTADRITELEREQRQLTAAIADLERRRREVEARAAAPARAGSITTRDLGTLQWPVDGTVVYRFGPDQRPGGIVLRHQGIGIGAPAGTPVRAVERGVVEYASAFPGYGPTVIVSHGGGYRTLYLYLREVSVRVGQEIPAGHVIGTVGGELTAEGAHIEFQVRVPMGGGSEPVDPLNWLRARSGTRQP